MMIFYLLVGAACPSYEAARDLLYSKKNSEATAALECRVNEYPEDLDSKRSLSDLYFRGNRTEQSEVLANEIKDTGSYYDQFWLVDRLSRWDFNLAYFHRFSRNFHTSEIQEGISYRYHQKNRMGVGTQLERRYFDEGFEQSDLELNFFHTWVPGGRFYLEKTFNYNPDPDFRSKWNLQVEPHLVGADPIEWDASVRADFRHYSELDVFLVSPALRLQVSPSVGVLMRANLALKPEQVVSVQSSLDLRLHRRFGLQADFAGGKSDEGEGFIDEFIYAGVSFETRLSSRWKWSLMGGLHNGKIRDEKSIGSGLSFRW